MVQIDKVDNNTNGTRTHHITINEKMTEGGHPNLWIYAIKSTIPYVNLNENEFKRALSAIKTVKQTTKSKVTKNRKMDQYFKAFDAAIDLEFDDRSNAVYNKI